MAFAPADMKLTSSAFDHHRSIPSRHAGDGEDVSPPLEWRGAPSGTRSFAVVCVDPDAPLVRSGRIGFVHWLLYDLAADVGRLPEGTSLGVAGRNDFGRSGYGGPMPPEGHGTHHYYLWILALDALLEAGPGLELDAFLAAAEPHLLGMSRLVGTYRRG